MSVPGSAVEGGVPAPVRILGLDLSLTSTGVATPDGLPPTYTWKPKTKGIERLHEFYAGTIQLCIFTRPDIAVLEGYAFSSVGRQHAAGEVGGVTRLALAHGGVPFVEVPPASLKKFATGKGNADKDAMLAAAIRRFGFEGEHNDEADAWLLKCMAQAAYGPEPDVIDLTQYQHEALKGVDWPALRGRKP